MDTKSPNKIPPDGESSDAARSIQTDTRIGLGNGLVQIFFSKDTGSLCSLKNLCTGTELIRESDPRGNPFRLYVDAGADPMLSPGSHDPRGEGQVIEPSVCALSSTTVDDTDTFACLTLLLVHADTGIEITVSVKLKTGSGEIDITLTAANRGSTAQSVRAALPYLAGLGVGADPETDLGLTMFDRGFPGDKAWTDTGGAYGKQVSMQWQCAYNGEDTEGVAFIAMDTGLQPKVLTRFSRGMQAYYANAVDIAPGGGFTWPSARIVVYDGPWRVAAAAYRKWFSGSMNPRPVPEWYRRQVTMRSSSWFPTAAQVAAWHEGTEESPRAVRSYRDFPRLYLDNSNDMTEHAMWNQDVVIWPEIYGPWMSAGFVGFREDLGGREAFIEGVEETHRLGRRVAMYVAGYGIRKNSPMFENGSWKDFAVLDPWGGEVTGGYVEGIFCCHGYKPWQDNIVRVCTMLAETGIDAIRLDELGMPFKPCFNPAHHHTNPYDSVSWSAELVKRVREAVDQINPECVITTEFYCDAYHSYTNGALVMGYAGSGIDVMKLALPSYLPVSYHAGCAEAAVTGAIPVRLESYRRDWPWEHLPFASKPEGHPDDTGPKLRWPELLTSFSDAVLYGETLDHDPFAPSDPRWKGHVWAAKNYHVLVGGYDDGTILEGGAIEVILPDTLPRCRYAYEFDAGTLEMSPRKIVYNNGRSAVELHHQISALFMPGPECPALVISTPDTDHPYPGDVFTLSLDSLRPWARGDSPASVSVHVPGCTVTPATVELPAAVTVQIPDNLEEGWYSYRIDGDTLPQKRWFRITERSASS